jgi:hypothetical protein
MFVFESTIIALEEEKNMKDEESMMDREELRK